MKTKTLAISILLLAVVLAPLAMAEEPAQRGPRGGQGGRSNFQRRSGGFGGHPGMGGFLLGRMGDKLELTEEQRTEIKGILEDCKEDQETTRTAVREAMKALHEAAADGTKAEIIAAGKTVGDAFTEQALLRAATMKQVKELLTDEQLTQFEELKAQMKERFQQRRKDGDGPRGPRGQNGDKGHDRQRRRPKPEQD